MRLLWREVPEHESTIQARSILHRAETEETLIRYTDSVTLAYTGTIVPIVPPCFATYVGPNQQLKGQVGVATRWATHEHVYFSCFEDSSVIPVHIDELEEFHLEQA